MSVLLLHALTADMPSRSRKSTGKREVIIRVAIETINAKSFALATMSEIAASLDLSNAALYYYFPNKQALGYACHLRSLERFEGLLNDAHKRAGSGASKLEHFFRTFLEESDRNGPQLYFGDYSYLNAEQRQAISNWATWLTQKLKALLDEGVVDGSLAPCETDLTVQLLLGMLIWLAKWVPGVEGLTVERLLRAIGQTTLGGLISR